MKLTAWKDAFRNIKKRFISWVSLVTIVFIGASVILGIYFAYSSLSALGDNYIRLHQSKDMDLACSLGIRGQEIDKILELDGIKDAEGYISFPGQITAGEKNGGAVLISSTERVSVPYLIEGRMPKEGNECALNPLLAQKLDISIGDEIIITAAQSRLTNTMINEKYIVTGFAEHPDYFSKSMVDYCVLPPSSFDTSESAFDYTNMAIKLDASDVLSSTSNKFSKEINLERKRIDEVTPEMGKERMASLSADLDREYEKAKAMADEKLAKAKAEIDSAQKKFDEEIAKAQKEIDDAEKELNEGKAKAERELAEGWKKIQDGEEEYNTKIADGERQLAEGKKQMEDELEHAKWQIFDGFLQIDQNEKLLGEKEAEYQRGLQAYLDGIEKLKQGREELDKGWNKYNEGLSELDSYLSSQTVIEMAKAFDAPDTQDISQALYDIANYETLERAEQLIVLYDNFSNEDTKEVVTDNLKETGIDTLRESVNMLSEGKNTLESKEVEYNNGRQALEDAKEELEEGRIKLDSGWFSIEQAKIKLAEGQNELAKKEPEARAQFAEKQAEFEQKKAEGAQQLEDAKKTYASEKKKAMDEIALHEKELQEGKETFESEKAINEAKLKDGWDQYYAGKKEAEDKLAEARREIDKAKQIECIWFVQTLDANIYFWDFKSSLQVLMSVLLVFAPIYSTIVVIVCFFTMSIIVEEQARQIGTCKALGMYNGEIRKKYLLFGATASIFGALLGIGGGMLMEKLISNSIETVLVFGHISHKFELLPLIIVPLGACFVSSVAVYWSSQIVLSCSAIDLVSGNAPKKRTRTKASKSTKRSVYTSLIFNNFLMDWGREMISIIIVFACIFLIGLGMSLKLGNSGALENQINNLFKYDVEIKLANNITDEQKQKVMEVVNAYDNYPLCKLQGVIQCDDAQTLTQIYCIEDSESFREYYCLTDMNGHNVELSDEGLMVSYEMIDKNNLSDGKDGVLITDNLKMGNIMINGHFLLHVGKTGIMSYDYYRKVFGEEPTIDSYLIKTGEDKRNEVADILSEMPGIAIINRSDDFIREKAGITELFDILVYVVIAFSIMLSFMILLNLSNILVSHRMKELLTMRVNGFSNWGVIGYLVREIIVTTGAGIVLGLVIGIPATSLILPQVEASGFMYLRKVFAQAWLLAVFCNTLFALMINSISFRRVNKVPLTDILKY